MLISGVGITYLSAFIPPYIGGLVFGIGSGAAMIPYTMIKEANPDNVKGSATGAMNFLVFSLVSTDYRIRLTYKSNEGSRQGIRAANLLRRAKGHARTRC